MMNENVFKGNEQKQDGHGEEQEPEGVSHGDAEQKCDSAVDLEPPALNIIEGSRFRKDRVSVLCQSLGAEERRLMKIAWGKSPRLNYPTFLVRMSNGAVVEVYDIPPEDKQSVFDKLYRLAIMPKLDDVRLDIHSNRQFRVRDFLVTREDGMNVLVSPWYPWYGGTVLDWATYFDRDVFVNYFSEILQPSSDDDDDDDDNDDDVDDDFEDENEDEDEDEDE